MTFAPFARRTLILGAVALGAFGCAPKQPDSISYVIFFNAQAAELDAEGNGVISEAANAAKAAPNRAVIVEGYADRLGTPQANQILSRLRTQVVADGLVAKGVDKARIQLQPKGATGGDPGIESRRVEIILR